MLEELQQHFQGFLLKGNREIHDNIISTENMSASQRLHIYEHAYYARLVEALAATYPSVQSYLGHDDFYQIACEYAKAFPSEFRSIRWFGGYFADFLFHHNDYHDYPHLAEIAEIEWLMSAVFDAKDQVPFTLEQLAKIPPQAWTDMTIKLHPSVKQLQLHWNSIAIWQDLIENKNPRSPQENAYPVSWIFWRKGLDNQYCSLEEEDGWALDAIKKGEDFGTVCEGLLQWNHEDDVALRAASLLKGWTEAGLIAEILY
ncbi:MAG: DNA-binding domain-containing protein [Gammaproteobacteria bacterium]